MCADEVYYYWRIYGLVTCTRTCTLIYMYVYMYMYMYNFVFQGVRQLCCCASFVRVCAALAGWLRQLDRRNAASSRPARPSHDRRPLQSRVHGMLFVFFSKYQSSYSDKNVQRCFTISCAFTCTCTCRSVWSTQGHSHITKLKPSSELTFQLRPILQSSHWLAFSTATNTLKLWIPLCSPYATASQ